MAKPHGKCTPVVLIDIGKGERPGSGWWSSCKPTSSAACPSKLVLVSYVVALKYALCVKN